MNDRACSTCDNYDGNKLHSPTKVVRDAEDGWCKAKSIYPAVDPDGRPSPPGVKRMPKGSHRSLPVIVGKDNVDRQCTEYVEKKT